jgi:hypothetical protein
LNNGLSDREFFYKVIQSTEYTNRNKVSTLYPPGHYHSPIVDPRTIVAYAERERQSDVGPEIDLPVDAMIKFWTRNLPFIQADYFTAAAGDNRYYYDNGFYGYGDATVLRAMIAQNTPAQIIEIGSGFSSACILDTIQHLGLETKLTCIEPYPARLRGLLRDMDGQVEIIACPVQEVSVERFTRLGPNDILFIDSTHVLKTGSDVHYELFHILPALRAQVLIHFHDVFSGFEYPRTWTEDRNLSWNEAYALRAFLMYNEAFSVEFFNSYFAKYNTQLIQATFAKFLINPGGSIWLRKGASVNEGTTIR